MSWQSCQCRPYQPMWLMSQETKMNITFSLTKFLTAMAVLANITALWASYYKNVAESQLATATTKIRAAQEGKSFLLLEPDGSCQKVEINFEHGEFKFQTKEKLVGVRKPTGNVEAFGQKCFNTVLDAMR